MMFCKKLNQERALRMLNIREKRSKINIKKIQSIKRGIFLSGHQDRKNQAFKFDRLEF